MQRSTFIGLVVVALIALAAAFAFHWYRGETVPEPPPPRQAPPAEAPARPQYPVPEPAAPEPAAPEQAPPPPLPDLGTSDEPFRSSVEALAGEAPVEAFLVSDEVIRKLVVSVDNLTGDSLGMRYRPFKRVDGEFETDMRQDRIYLSPVNYARYNGFVHALSSTDTQALVDLYFRWYPRFQEAYEDLGYPGRYFNDRVVEVIDHLLATPEVTGPIALVRPKVMYQFADPDLEALSVGQKALIRMGPDNAARVKAKLREIREAIVARTRQAPAAAGE